MPVSLSVENVPAPVAEALRVRAARHHRSLQGELLDTLGRAALEQRLSIGELHEHVRELGLETRSSSARIVRASRDRR